MFTITRADTIVMYVMDVMNDESGSFSRNIVDENILPESASKGLRRIWLTFCS